MAGFGRSGGKKTTLSDQEENFSNGTDWSNSSEANRSDKSLGKLEMTHTPSPPLLTHTWELTVQGCSASSSVAQRALPGWHWDSTSGQPKARGEARCHPLDWHPQVLSSKAYISSWVWWGSFRADVGAVSSPTEALLPQVPISLILLQLPPKHPPCQHLCSTPASHQVPPIWQFPAMAKQIHLPIPSSNPKQGQDMGGHLWCPPVGHF